MADQRTPQRGPPSEQLRAALPYLLILLLLAALVHSLTLRPGGIEISYIEFKRRVAQGEVAEVVFRDSEIAGRLHQAQRLGKEGAES